MYFAPTSRHTGGAPARFIRVVSCVLVLVAALALPSTAGAQAVAPPTLTGETFETADSPTPGEGCVGLANFPPICIQSPTGQVVNADVTCDETGGTVNYAVEGLAEGPYPGTYRETGTITLAGGPPPTSGISRDVIGFEATFTVDSPTGQVSGRKTLDPTAAPTVAQCGDFGDRAVVDFRALATYEARIETANGAFADRGQTELRGGFVDNRAIPNEDYGNLVEAFRSSLLVTEPIPAAPNCNDDSDDGGTDDDCTGDDGGTDG